MLSVASRYARKPAASLLQELPKNILLLPHVAEEYIYSSAKNYADENGLVKVEAIDRV